MKKLLINLRSSALIGAILVIPWMILELVNRRMYNEDFPFGLFVILWLLPVAFLMILLSMVQNIRVGNNILVSPLGILIGVALLILIAWLWVGTVMDQMPCFVGVPNCD